MRNTFIQRLTQAAKSNRGIYLLVGDLGYSVVESFVQQFPDRFFNCGVAEQAMTGMAAGLALTNPENIVFTYSIANFPILRCFEQVRNDVCFHQANVKILSVGGGISYGTLGYSHFGIEDLGALHPLPHLTIATPSDPFEAIEICNIAIAQKGPWYIRLGKNGEKTLDSTSPVTLGTPRHLWGDPLAKLRIFATGPIAEEALKAAQNTETSCCVYSTPFFKPIHRPLWEAAMYGAQLVITLEEHSPWGGLRSIMNKLISESTDPAIRHISMLPLHLPEAPDAVGSQEALRHHYQLDAQGITMAIRRCLDHEYLNLAA